MFVDIEFQTWYLVVYTSSCLKSVEVYVYQKDQFVPFLALRTARLVPARLLLLVIHALYARV